ncbi:MAG TPA: LysR substrate-binding domain-containing protein, partial [Myxococcales bacterium]|nr:LysR substrate-binding domain-containing protein [Myxococcales bacterium]
AAVSKAVLKLEEKLGVKLLLRTSRAVALTPEGAAFVTRCREAISSLQAGHEQLWESRRQPRGELSLSLPFILGRVVVPALPRLTARYPDLSVRVTMTDRLVRLQEEQVDVGVRVGAREDSALISRSLGGSRWVTVAAPSYLARHGEPARPEELAKHTCVQFVAPNGRPRDWTFADGKGGPGAEVKVEGRLRIDQGELMLEAAAAGFGVCQVLDFMVGERLREGRLREVLQRFSAQGPRLHAVAAPERARTPNVKACFAFLADAFARA